MYYTKQVVYEINYEMWNCPNSWFEILSRSYVSIAIPPRMQKESSGGLITSHIFSFYQGLRCPLRGIKGQLSRKHEHERMAWAVLCQ